MFNVKEGHYVPNTTKLFLMQRHHIFLGMPLGKNAIKSH